MEEVCSLVSKLERKSSKRKSQREQERMKKNQAATEKVRIRIKLFETQKEKRIEPLGIK